MSREYIRNLIDRLAEGVELPACDIPQLLADKMEMDSYTRTEYRAALVGFIGSRLLAVNSGEPEEYTRAELFGSVGIVCILAEHAGYWKNIDPVQFLGGSEVHFLLRLSELANQDTFEYNTVLGTLMQWADANGHDLYEVESYED